ncbi:MAG: AsmA family protein, partial [Maribacter dokdonensis]
KLIAKIDDATLTDLTIPVVASIGGAYNSPTVTTDLTSGVKALTSKLIEIEKQKLINKGTDKAKDLIGGLISGNKAAQDSVSGETPSTKTSAKDILGGILATKKDTATTVKKDSTPAKIEKEAVKEKAKDILGGLFGNKKKDSTN